MGGRGAEGNRRIPSLTIFDCQALSRAVRAVVAERVGGALFTKTLVMFS